MTDSHIPRPSLLNIAMAAIAVALPLTAPSAKANEILPKNATCGECPLILNGSAVRSVWGFDVYVVGLYLMEPNGDERDIMTRDPNGKRVHISMLRGVKSDKFESTIQKNIDVNLTAAEKKQYQKELQSFLDCFGDGSALKKGDVITIDYLPTQGTVVTLGNGKYEPIPGHEFYHVLLRLWIGNSPQESVKEGLLGMRS